MARLKLFWFKLRVCIWGAYVNSGHWVWDDISDSEWVGMYEWFGSDYRSAYVEGWCRE